MLYRSMGQTGDQVSILGYGCMRFPQKNGRIDEALTERQVISAIEQGVNYFDTAFIYPGSEITLGKILAKGYRDRVMLATKLPLFMVHSLKDMENIFATQLKRLQTDRIDYYLMHAMSTWEGWLRLKQLGVEEFLASKKREGLIRRVGFSFHGNTGPFKQVVDDYPWDFSLIQYNYMDEFNQVGKEGLAYAAAKGLGVAIMEPLRGGFLVKRMPPQIQAIWDRAEAKRSLVEWALRWVWNHPEVSVVLSGMNEEAHVNENIRIAGSAQPLSLSERELQLFGQVKAELARMMKVGCTGCGYCMPCPAGVNIPSCFSHYNDRFLFNDPTVNKHYAIANIGMDGGEPSYASLCRNCGKCEAHCPQGIPIRKHLKDAARELERFYFGPLAGLVRGYYKLRGRGKKVK